ncbi:MAG: alpha/beta hydrolase-fold protein [Candidatus Neomarinimicrobiota bacterium]
MKQVLKNSDCPIIGRLVFRKSVRLLKLVKTTPIVITVLALLIACGPNRESIKIGKIHRIQSAILNESRLLYIYTPANYSRSDSDYPVLYLLDGATHFHYATGIIEFLSARVQIPQMIVVGIETLDSDHDFVPPTADATAAGRADQFLNFIADEVVPYVEEQYRSQPYRILAGHSQGGLCVLYSLLSQPGLFNAYFASSPWLDDSEYPTFEQADNLLASPGRQNRFLYLAYSSSEYYLLDNIQQFITKLQNSAPSTLNWTAQVLDSECHETTQHPGLYFGLKKLYAKWRVPHSLMSSDLQTIDDHFAAVSEEFGYMIPAPEAILNIIGYRLLSGGEIDEAIAIFKRNAELYPNSANVFDGLGEVYETAGELEKALASYNMAYELAMRVDDPNLNSFKEHILRLRQKLKSR